MDDQEIKRKVREGYARAAQQDCCCAPSDSTCCSGADTVGSASRRMGYSDKEIKEVPEGSNLGLGCGNPTAIASLKPGETVLDLGSGAGFDCFLAAARVGKDGRVIGVDMTSEMIDKARENARKGDFDNVEFRLGEIEHLPVANSTVDIIISNCVINLAPDKDRVFREAFRVLKPGGRIMVSDIVLKKELPETIRRSVEAYVGCIAGASLQAAYLGAIEAAGFEHIEVISEREINVTSIAKQSEDPGAAAASINVAAVKP